mgnify:CR=1 FL=1
MDLGVHQYYVPQILRLFFGAAHNSNASAALGVLHARVPGRERRSALAPAGAAGRGAAMAEIVAAMAMTLSWRSPAGSTRASEDYQRRRPSPRSARCAERLGRSPGPTCS